MKTHSSKEVVEIAEQQSVTAPGAVDIVCNLHAIRKLEPFMRDEHTLTTAAASIGVAPSTVAYWIPKFRRSGLLHVVRHEQRKGMAMTWYRASARSYFVPMSALPGDARARFVDSARAGARQRFVTALNEAEKTLTSAGLTFVPHPERGVSISYSPPDPPVTGIYELYASVALTATELADLERLLEELELLAAKTGDRPGATRHLLQLGLAPEPPAQKRPRRRAI